MGGESRINSAARARLRERRVVFVSDDRETLTTFRRLLGSLPCQILTTDRPDQALKWVWTTPVSIVLSDERTRAMSGKALLRKVPRQSPLTARLLLTGSHSGRDVIQVRGRALQGVIVKPWEAGSLQRLILSILLWQDEKHCVPEPKARRAGLFPSDS